MLTLPIAAVVASGIATCTILSLAWWFLGTKVYSGAEVVPNAVAMTAGVWAVQVCVYIAICPWKTREASTWMAWWMGATIIRLLVTSGAVALLYFPPPENPRALLMAAGLAYVAMLFVEVGIVAIHLSNQLERIEQTSAL